MIDDTKQPQSIERKEGKKGYTLTWTDGKKDTIFDEVWAADVRLCVQNGWFLHFTKEKNDSGFWNIQTLEIVREGTPENNQNPETPCDKQKSIESQQAAEYVTRLWESGKINEDHPLAKKLINWCNGRL